MTKEQYIKELKKGITEGSKVIKDVLWKYFKESHRYYVGKSSKTEESIYDIFIDYRVFFNIDIDMWNCTIKGLSISKTGKVLVEVYWQGDSTDGTQSVPLSDILSNKEYVIDRTKEHSILRIQREWLKEAYKEVANILEQ